MRRRAQTPLPANQAHRLRLRMGDTKVLGYFDGVEACMFTGVQTLEGFPAIHFRGETDVWRADNFVVTAP